MVNRRFSLSSLVISFTYIPRYLYGILIGLILGDGFISLSQGRKNAHFRFLQGVINSGFFWHVYSLFSHYSQSLPIVNISKRRGKLHSALVFWTRSYPFLTDLYYLFYVSGRKRIPWCISELLTPEGLAMWAMSDGCKAKGGFYLSTNSFHYEEVQLLCNALKERFNLDCSVHSQRGQPRLYISANSMPLFRSIVFPYFHSSMMYKLR